MKRITTLLLVGVLLTIGFIPLHVLEIRDVRKGKTVFMQRVSPAETFSITFIHSVEKSPVTDYFRIDDAFRIVLYETAFRSLNTGLPATISEGQTLTRTEKGFRLSILDNVLPDIQLWVDDRYAGTLEIGGRFISLAALAGNTLLMVRVRKIPLWEYAFRIIY
ncbi:MAG: DUF1850 domain-containing protein [Deltaproteobacteria bacterium]|nr:DUF1850 domain-containing protein [Deltaproteobacteria bacterium]